VIPDFVVSHSLSRDFQEFKASVVAPLFHIFQAMFVLLGREIPVTILTWPSPKIRQRHERSILELEIQVDEDLDFELDLESAVVSEGKETTK
jgi:hypothetical protein